MGSISRSELTERIVEKVKLLGATIAGVASVKSLKGSPSHRIYPKNGLQRIKTTIQTFYEVI